MVCLQDVLKMWVQDIVTLRQFTTSLSDGPVSVLGSIDILIKPGGSVITDKSHLETFKDTAISEAVKLIKLYVDKGLKVVLVHDASSFGLQQSQEYSVKQGWRKDDGVSKIRKGFFHN